MSKANQDIHIQQKVEDFCLGDNDAFAFLFKLWQTELFFCAYHFLKNDKDAEDVLYQSFEKILITDIDYRREKFIEEGISLKLFLKAVVKNGALDALKIKKNRFRIINNIKHLWDKHSINEAILTEQEAFTVQLLSPLKPKEKDIMLMHVQGYSIDEISAKYFLSKKTISNTIAATKQKLKNIWKNNKQP
jgi:RNA polymerase sigma factor (sigma-70 family)